MKKILILTLSIAVVLSFVGCGNKNGKNTSSSPNKRYTSSEDNSSSTSKSSDEYFSSEIATTGNLSDIKIGDYVVYTPDRSQYTTSGKRKQ